MTHRTGSSGSNGNGKSNGSSGSGSGSGEQPEVAGLAPEDKNRVINFAQMREKRLEQKVRQNERVVFGNLLSVYSVTGESKIHSIDIIEVSEEGLSFQIPAAREKPWVTSENEIPIRMYFSADTFLEILVKVKHSRPSIDHGEKYVRYGCSVDTTTQSFPVYQLFVQFLKQYAKHAHRDMGKVSAFYR